MVSNPIREKFIARRPHNDPLFDLDTRRLLEFACAILTRSILDNLSIRGC